MFTEWYVCLQGEAIIAGMGVIENDFHDRKDPPPTSAQCIRRRRTEGKGSPVNSFTLWWPIIKPKGFLRSIW